MTEIKLLKISELFDTKNIKAHSQARKILEKRTNIPRREWIKTLMENGDFDYKVKEKYSCLSEQECVVAFCKNNLGVVFIIKNGNTYFSFVHYFSQYHFYGNFNTFRLKEKEAISIIMNEEQEMKLIEQDIKERIESIEVLKELKK